MKTCLIPPIPDLDRFVDETFTHHLLLAHLCDIPGPLGHAYTAFYKQRAERGDYLILDNSTKELGDAIGLEYTLALAKALGASEVVLSDIRQSAVGTLEATERDLTWLLSEGLALYQEAGKPALMIVPQGGSFPAWQACLVHLLEKVETANRVLGGPPPVIGVAYAYAHLFERPFRELVYIARAARTPVHLLGWPRDLGVLLDIATEFPDVRSVDSSRPFVYAKAGLKVGEADYPGRDERYFIESIPVEHHRLACDNIEVFQMYAEIEEITA